MNFKILLFFGLLFLSSCDFQTETKKAPETTEAPTTEITKEIPSYVCIPNKQVGKIQANFSEEDIIAAYGKENVARKDIGIGEGEITKGTIVFPGAKNELVVEWDDTAPFKKLRKIRIEKQESSWATEEGIQVGSTLEELIKTNGKDFKFHGFEWDYGGITNDWDGGKINKQLVVMLEPGNPEAVYPELLGDKLFSSNHPKAKAADLKVAAMSIFFNL